MIWQQFKTPEVRDLAWSCFSAELIDIASMKSKTAVSGFKPKLNSKRKQWLTALDSNPLPLLDYINISHSRRLGLYFEALWQYFLTEDPQFDLVAHNLTVYEGSKTYGEFDIIYYDRERNCHCHLELALKYYLGVPFKQNKLYSHLSQWIGPGCEDRLDIKLRRLLDHQIRLSEYPQAKQALKSLNIQKLEHQVVLKGYLFNSQIEPLAKPEHLNPQTTLYSWSRASEFRSTLNNGEAENWLHLPKRNWLADSHYNQGLNPINKNNLEDYICRQFSDSPRPLLLSPIKDDQAQSELTRHFITPDHWPSCIYPRKKY